LPNIAALFYRPKQKGKRLKAKIWQCMGHTRVLWANRTIPFVVAHGGAGVRKKVHVIGLFWFGVCAGATFSLTPSFCVEIVASWASPRSDVRIWNP